MVAIAKNFVLIPALLLLLLLFSCGAFAVSPRNIWNIGSGFDSGVFFSGANCYVATGNFCPQEMGWEGNTVYYIFNLGPNQAVAKKVELEFNVVFRNFNTAQNVLLDIYAGSNKSSLTLVKHNLNIDRLGTFTVFIDSSVFKKGAANYIKFFGTNISPIGYGKNPPNFKIDFIGLNEERNVLLLHMNNNWLDSSGNWNNGTSMGGASFSYAKFGIAGGIFDGVDDFVRVPDSTALRLGTEQTISVWFDAASLPPDYFRLVGKSNSADKSKRNYGLWIDKTGKTLYQICSSGTCCNLWGGTAAANSGWHHLVGTRTGNTMRIYLDGVLKGTATCAVTPPTSTDPLAIAFDTGLISPGRYFNGKLDDVAIWNTALTNQEIMSIYQAEVSNPVYRLLRIGNVLLMHMDYAPLNQWLDSSLYDNDGTGMGGIGFPGPPKVGYGAGSFDGIDDHVDISDCLSLRLGKEQTVSAWVNVREYPADYARLIGKSSSADASKRNYGLWIDKTGKTLYQICNGACCNLWGPSINKGEWHHVLGTRTGNTMKIYLDGVMQGSMACEVVPPTPSDSLMLGYEYGDAGGSGRFFNGYLDEAAVWNRPLSDAEIYFVYGMGVTGQEFLKIE